MAAKNKKSNGKKIKKPNIEQAKQESKAFLTSENVRFVAGVVLLLFSLYMLLSFVSFFFTGTLDQTVMESGNSTRTVSNWGGMLGASISFYFINQCFGLASVFIPVFFVMISLRLLKIGKIRLWKWFANFAFLIIWFSVALQFFIPDNILNQLFFTPGGKHGQFVCDNLILKLGKPGTFLVLLIAVLIYLVYLSDETIRCIKKTFKKLSFKNQKTTDESEENVAETTENPDNVQELPEEKPVEETPDEPSENTEDNEDWEKEDSKEKDKDSDENNESAIDGVELYDPRKDLEYYKFPSVDLLKHYDDDGVLVTDAENRQRRTNTPDACIIRRSDIGNKRHNRPYNHPLRSNSCSGSENI